MVTTSSNPPQHAYVRAVLPTLEEEEEEKEKEEEKKTGEKKNKKKVQVVTCTYFM